MQLYTVQPKDTLWDISQRFYRTPLLWPQLFAYNNRESSIEQTGTVIFDPDLILIGQALVIPKEKELTSDPDKIKKQIKELREKQIKQSNQSSDLIKKIRQRQPQPNDGSEAMGRAPALAIAQPAWEFDLAEQSSPEAKFPGGTIKVTYKGKLSIQSTQPAKITITGQGFKQAEIKSQQETATSLGNLISETKVTNIDLEKRTATLSSGLTFKSNMPNSIEVQLHGDFNERGLLVLKGVAKQTLLKGKVNQHIFTSNEVSIEVEISVKEEDARAKNSSQTSFSMDFLKSTTATGIILTAGIIVVGTIAEDIITLGWGIADDPISFAAAYGMTRYALTILSTSGRRVMTQGVRQAHKSYKYIEKAAAGVYKGAATGFSNAYSWAASTPLVLAVDDLISDDK